jgi:hypothetical protein
MAPKRTVLAVVWMLAVITLRANAAEPPSLASSFPLGVYLVAVLFSSESPNVQ